MLHSRVPRKVSFTTYTCSQQTNVESRVSLSSAKTKIETPGFSQDKNKG